MHENMISNSFFSTILENVAQYVSLIACVREVLWTFLSNANRHSVATVTFLCVCSCLCMRHIYYVAYENVFVQIDVWTNWNK